MSLRIKLQITRMNKVRKAGRYLLILISVYLLYSAGRYILVWKSVSVDPSLSAKQIFRDFDHQKQEYIDGGESGDIKTNNFRVKTDSLSTESYRCDIEDHPLSLWIRLSTGDESSYGYLIKITNGRYTLSSYHHTDAPRMFDFFSTEYDRILSSRLILNQASYQKGDRISGYVEVKEQKGYGAEKYFKEGKGYFKGIVR